MLINESRKKQGYAAEAGTGRPDDAHRFGMRIAALEQAVMQVVFIRGKDMAPVDAAPANCRQGIKK